MGKPPIVEAAKRRDCERVQELLDEGADVNVVDFNGRQAVHWACLRRHLPTLQRLYAAGASLTAISDDGCTPLMIASYLGHATAVRWLLWQADDSPAIRAQINHRGTFDCATALHGVSYLGKLEMARLLLAAGADPTLCNRKFKTAKDLVCQCPGRSFRDGTERSLRSVLEKAEQEFGRSTVSSSSSSSAAAKPSPSSALGVQLKPSVFLQLLLDKRRRESVQDNIAAHAFLSECSTQVVNLVEVKIWYTVLRAVVRQDILTQERSEKLLHPSLDKVAGQCVNQDTWVCFQMVIEKCYQDGWINEERYLRYKDQSLMKRIEHADFILDMKDAIVAATANIQWLENSLERVFENFKLMEQNIDILSRNINEVHGGLENLKSGMRLKRRMEGIIHMVSGMLGSLTLGIGGAVGSACKLVFNKIVDFADTVHINNIIHTEVKDLAMRQFILDSFQRGTAAVQQHIDLQELAEMAVCSVVDGYTDKRLEDALKEGKSLFPLCAIGYAAVVVTASASTGQQQQQQASGKVPGTNLAPTVAGSGGDSRGGNFAMWPDAVFDEDDDANEDLELHVAVKFGDEETTHDTLAGFGSCDVYSINYKDNRGRTAMDLAALTGQTKLMNILEDAGGQFSGKKVKMKLFAKTRSEFSSDYLKYVHGSLK